MRKCSQICKIFVWKVFLLRLEEWDGVQDEFGEVGPVDYLRERFGLTDENITAAVHRVLQRKH